MQQKSKSSPQPNAEDLSNSLKLLFKMFKQL
jgi:hypothetical protein